MKLGRGGLPAPGGNMSLNVLQDTGQPLTIKDYIVKQQNALLGLLLPQKPKLMWSTCFSYSCGYVIIICYFSWFFVLSIQLLNGLCVYVCWGAYLKDLGVGVHM